MTLTAFPAYATNCARRLWPLVRWRSVARIVERVHQ